MRLFTGVAIFLFSLFVFSSSFASEAGGTVDDFYSKSNIFKRNADLLHEFNKLSLNVSEKFNKLDREAGRDFIKKLKKKLEQEGTYMSNYYKLIDRVCKRSDNPDYKVSFPFAVFSIGSKMHRNIEMAIDILKDYPEFLQHKMPSDFTLLNEPCFDNGNNLLCKPMLVGIFTMLIVADKMLTGNNYINDENIINSPVLDSFLIFKDGFYQDLVKSNRISNEEIFALKNSLFIKSTGDSFILNVIYNGYIFGGNKKTNYPVNPSNKKYTSEDCSTYVFKKLTREDNFLNGAEYTGFFYYLDAMNQEVVSTDRHDKLLNLRFMPFYFKMQHFLRENNYHLFEVDSFNKLKAGDILVWRYFKGDGDLFGSRGHIGHVINKESDYIEFFSLRREYGYYDAEKTLKDKIFDLFYFRNKETKYLQSSSYCSYCFQRIRESDLKGFKLLVLRKNSKGKQQNIYDFEYLSKLYKEVSLNKY